MKTNNPETIDQYIKAFPADLQKILRKVRATIKKAAPEAEEAIKYGIPTFTLNGNLVHFAGWKSHLGFYPGSSAIRKFKRELASYELSRGTIKFPHEKPLPLGLVTKIVRFRIREVTRNRS